MNIHMNTHMLSVTCSIRICDTIHWITHTLVAYIHRIQQGCTQEAASLSDTDVPLRVRATKSRCP